MSEQNNNAACSGDCSSCTSNCESITTGTTIPLQMEDGQIVECLILTTFELGVKNYIVLLPLDEDGMAEGEEVFIYQYSHSEEGSPVLENIMDDEEYAMVSAAFEQFLGELHMQEELSGIIENEDAAN